MKCPNCSKTYPSGVTQCGDCEVQLIAVASIKLNPTGASSDTLVDWNNPSAESVDNDLAGWWDQGPAALEPSESVDLKAPLSTPAAAVSPQATPAPPAPASFSLGAPPSTSLDREDSLHDSWGAAPASLSIQDSRFAMDESASFGGSSAGTSAGSREQTLSNKWAELEAPLDDSWSPPPPERRPTAPPLEEPQITIPKLTDRGGEFEDLPPGAPKIGFDSIPVHDLEPTKPVPSAEPDAALPTAANSGGSLVRSLLLVLVVGALAVGGFAYSNQRPDPLPTNTPVAPEIEHDAETWLASARESLEAENFALAVPQLERALELLKAEGAELQRIKTTQLELAKAYARNKQHEECRELWLSLAEYYPDLAKQAAEGVNRSERQLRVQANAKLKKGAGSLKQKPRLALVLGEEALDAYTRYGGQNGQIAQAHGLIADAFRAENSKRRAAKHYKLANDFDPKGPYLKRLREMGPITTRPRKKPPVPVKKPRFIPKTSVPKAK